MNRRLIMSEKTATEKSTINKIITEKLQRALQLEIAAYLQYLSHAAVVVGSCSPGVIAQLEDNAQDEAKHADQIRNLLGNFLDVYPTGNSSEQHKATNIPKILTTNITDEILAIETYQDILTYLDHNKEFEYYYKFAETIRLILIEEQEHVSELRTLMD